MIPWGSPLPRKLPELAAGCSVGDCGKEDAGETGKALPAGCSGRALGPPGWPEEPACTPPRGHPDRVGSGSWAGLCDNCPIAGEQPEAWKYSDQQWPEATLNLLPIGGESLESVPRKPDAQRGAPNHWDVFSSNLLGAPLMSAFLSSVYRAVRGDPSFPH